MFAGVFEIERYQFTTTASETDIVAYYKQEMVLRRWEQVEQEVMTAVPSMVPGLFLAFHQKSTFMYFTINSHGSNNDVLIVIRVPQ